MNCTEKDIRTTLSCLSENLITEILDASAIKEFPQGTELLREGQYINSIPLVLKGLIKVFAGYDEKELLLYYIQPGESCVMLLAAGLHRECSKVFALTEEDTTALFLPMDKVNEWLKKYPEMNMLFIRQYDIRYNDMLDTIRSVLFDKMDIRLYKYLEAKVKLTKTNPLKLSHKQIAIELGTAREVISRVMKRLEDEGKVKQISNNIHVM